MKTHTSKTYSAKPADVTRKWHIVDASVVPLGRLATQVATLLMGKHKPMFTAHIDCGDFVIVTNAAQLVVTGGKEEKKKYYRHTGFPGGIKEASLNEKMEQDPTQVIVKAVRGMIPDNKLRPGRLARLKVYADENHNHSAQQPEVYSLKENK
jgi:large subunit ribosomal protein L13